MRNRPVEHIRRRLLVGSPEARAEKFTANKTVHDLDDYIAYTGTKVRQ